LAKRLFIQARIWMRILKNQPGDKTMSIRHSLLYNKGNTSLIHVFYELHTDSIKIEINGDTTEATCITLSPHDFEALYNAFKEGFNFEEHVIDEVLPKQNKLCFACEHKRKVNALK
jgi:hypothetical protein